VAAALAFLVAVGVYLYAFGPPGEARKPIVAVLPFRSLDAQDESLVAGIWEDTRTAIGRNPQLVVLGPNTAQALADKGEAAARKAADYILEASVRTAGDRVRVSTDLVRTRDGEQVWSQDFDRKLDDVFALQSQIATEIEGRIRGRLAEKGGTTPEHIATSGDVYALYADARAKVRTRDFGDQVAAGARELQQVVRMDPNFAPGWAALAVASRLVSPSHKNWDLADHSDEYARKAVDLAPNLAAAHSALAFALDLKGPVARAEVERAVELDPNDYEALTWFGNMHSDAGDKNGAIASYRRAAAIEPFFWPAVMNLYEALKDIGDKKGIQQLIEDEDRVGATYLSSGVRMQNAYEKGNLAEAANIGLKTWTEAKSKNRPTIGVTLWTVLLQLGFADEAAKLGTGPDFARYLWNLDPRGLDILEAHRMDAHTFFMLQPLTENASRLYLLSGRGKKVADMYVSLAMQPAQFETLASGDGPNHFVACAPLIAIALKENGHRPEAAALLSLAEQRARTASNDGKPESSAWLARVYAAEGRKEEAVSLIVSAVSRGWVPRAPELLPDLHVDPALASLKGDQRFEKARDQILGVIARERAQVNLALVRKLDSLATN
jgi:TolB-like protein